MRNYRCVCLALGWLLFAQALPLLAQPAEPSPDLLPVVPSGESPAHRDARMKWWREARFGMIIHWGLYSIPAGTWQGRPVGGIGEWIMNNGHIPLNDYARLASQFNPRRYDADAWVRTARDAGMKYIIITAKHHDGFALFQSAASAYNVVDATPYHHDPLKDLVDACRKYGVRIGFYYSQAQDWHHPGGAARRGKWDPGQYGSFDEYLRRIAAPQVRELLSKYGPIDILWWDTQDNPPDYMSRERAAPLAELLKLQPNIISNNRLGGGFTGDTDTPEQRISGKGYSRDWEACMTMNDTWGYKSYDDNWKPAALLLRNLVDIASKGGNYLLNVGPTADGEIPGPSIERLRVIGAWLKRNGEAIYATQASPFGRLPWGRVTQKPGRLYLHVFDWPKDGWLLVPMHGTPARAYVLGRSDAPLAFSSSAEGLRVLLPPAAPEPIVSVIVLDGVSKVDALPAPPLRPEPGGSILLGCDDASLVGQGLRIEGHTQLDITDWTRTDAYPRWEVQFARPGTYEVSAFCFVPPKQAGSEFVVTAGPERLTARTASTGRDYATVSLGSIRISQAGLVRIELRPTRLANHEFMRLRTLLFEPAGTTRIAWHHDTPTPEPRAGYGVGVLGGRLILIGGTFWEGNKGNWTKKVFTAATHAFHPFAHVWEKLPDAPVTLGYPASAQVGDEIYVLGGVQDGRPSRNVLALRQEKGGFAWRKATPLPENRVFGSAVTIGRTIYLIGGTREFEPFDAKGTCCTTKTDTSTVWSLDTANPAADWKALESYPGQARWNARAATDGHSIFLFGGVHRPRQQDPVLKFNEVLRFDPAANRWSRAADLPESLQGAAAVAVGGKIVLLGAGRQAMSFDPRTASFSPAEPLPEDAAVDAFVWIDPAIVGAAGENKIEGPRRRSESTFVGNRTTN